MIAPAGLLAPFREVGLNTRFGFRVPRSPRFFHGTGRDSFGEVPSESISPQKNSNFSAPPRFILNLAEDWPN